MNSEQATAFMWRVFIHVKHGDEKHQEWLRTKLVELAPELLAWAEECINEATIGHKTDGR
jgi:hypothetical protein